MTASLSRWSRQRLKPAAAEAMGYHACHNVAGGFEGPLDDERHRGTAGGWQAAGLPWLKTRASPRSTSTWERSHRV